MTNRLKWVVLVSLLPMGACATKGDLRDLQGEIRALALRQDSAFLALARLNEATRDSLLTFSDDLFNFRGSVNNQLLDIQDQLVRLGELTGQGQRSLAGLRDQIEAQRRQLAEQPRPPRDEASDSLATDEDVPDEDIIVEGVMSTAEEDFNAAVQQLNRGNFTVATMAFRSFLEEHPDHPLTPRAHLNYGELLSQQNRLEDAAAEYLRIHELFPTAPEVPEALFRAGALYLEMENFDLARQYLQQVINSYGDHAVADLARQRLEDIP